MMNGTTVLWAHESQEWIPSPRSKEGILTDCFSHMRNRVTPMRSGGWSIPPVSWLQGRPNSSVGKGRIKKRRLPTER